jgi:hypothetical protein
VFLDAQTLFSSTSPFASISVSLFVYFTFSSIFAIAHPQNLCTGLLRNFDTTNFNVVKIPCTHKLVPCRKKACSLSHLNLFLFFYNYILIYLLFLAIFFILFASGWLTKEGGSFFKNWKRRWCVLDPNAGTLTYYETQNTSQKPNGVVLLEGTTVARLAKKAKGKDNCFVITGPDRTFYAFADKSDEADSWVETLTKAFAATFYSLSYHSSVLFLEYV